MPPQNNAYEWINIRDFRPGIADNPGANYPPGQAQRQFTWRCIANRAGALVPLPQGIPMNMIGIIGEADTAAIDGLYLPPITVAPQVETMTLSPPHELVVGSEILFGGQRFQRLHRFRRYSLSSLNYSTLVSRADPDTSAPVSTLGGFHPVGMSFGTTRSNRANPNIPGVPVFVANWWLGPGVGYLIEFPDDQNPGSGTPYLIFSNNTWIASVTAHQARVVVDKIAANSHGPGGAVAIMSENVSWSATSDVTPGNFSTPDIVFVVENPSGLAFMHSMSANELFAVKSASGGVYVSGDLNYATIVNLPLVTGCDIGITPVSSDVGVIYASRSSGVWAWSHGDTSTLLSPQMDPLFWTLVDNIGTGIDDFGGISYQFARSDDWVLCPNNFLYDTQLKSWWRLEQPTAPISGSDVATSPQFRYMAANFRYFYGAHSWFSQAVPPPAGVLNTPVWYYDRSNPSNNFSWCSQPLWETVDSLVDIREITLRVEGAGVVYVELRGESNPNNPTIIVFDQFITGVPVLIRKPVRIQDSNISVRIVSFTNVAGWSIAPTVHECNIGYITVQKERTTA